MADATANESSKPAVSAPRSPAARTNLLLLIIVVVLSLLFVGGIVATFIIVRSGNPTAAVAQAKSEDAASEDGQAEKPAKPKESENKKPKKEEKKEGPKPAAIYVTLEPPFVVNFPAGKPAKFLQIQTEIMTRDAATAQLLKDNNPLLRNDLLMLYGSQQYEVVAAPEGKEALRGLALDAVRAVAKKEGGKPGEVEAVYFTSFVMQ